LGFSYLSVRKKEADNEDDDDSDDDSDDEFPNTPSPKRKSRKKKGPEVLGTIATPQGRRSGRLMAKKEA